jgi:hypothetical protein
LNEFIRHTSTQDLFPLNDQQGQIKSQRDSFSGSGMLCGFQNNFNTSSLHLKSSFDFDNQNHSFGQTSERRNSRNFLNSPLKLNDQNYNSSFRADEDTKFDDIEDNIDASTWDVEEVKNWLISCNMNDLTGTC